jgi:hypothetical protein
VDALERRWRLSVGFQNLGTPRLPVFSK